MLQLLTTTGCRNEAFALCQRWMSNQTVKCNVKWVIVDDGETPQDITFEREGWELQVIRPEPFWREGDNTQKRNLLVGLDHIDRDIPLFIIEDDDYYHPMWLQRVMYYMQKYDLVGEKYADYYNVQTCIHRRLQNGRGASLCASAFKKTGYDALVQSCDVNTDYIDQHIWKHFKGPRRLLETNYVIGMKGMPGRTNIGLGKNLKGDDDRDFSILRRLIGEDAKYYESL